MSHVTLAWPPVQKEEAASTAGFRADSVAKSCMELGNRYLVPCCSSLARFGTSESVKSAPLIDRTGGSSNKPAVRYKPVNRNPEDTGSFTIEDEEDEEQGNLDDSTGGETNCAFISQSDYHVQLRPALSTA